MALVRWEPLREMASLFDTPTTAMRMATPPRRWMPALDIQETEDHFVLRADVPGMGEEALAILRAGDYFGEMALIDDFPRSADARVHEAARLFVIRKEDMEDLLFVDRDLAYDLLWNFVRTLSTRLRETNDKMTFLAVSNRF